jgi:hypothetical protein
MFDRAEHVSLTGKAEFQRVGPAASDVVTDSRVLTIATQDHRFSELMTTWREGHGTKST